MANKLRILVPVKRVIDYAVRKTHSDTQNQTDSMAARSNHESIKRRPMSNET